MPLVASSAMALTPQSVSNPTHRLDEVGVIAELLTQRLNVDIDRSAATVEVPAPNALQKRLTVEHHTGRPHEER